MLLFCIYSVGLFLDWLRRLIFYCFREDTNHNKFATFTATEPIEILIILGSGGHTTEMLKLIEYMDFSEFQAKFFLAKSDHLSEIRLKKFFQHKRGFTDEQIERLFTFQKITRCHEIMQLRFFAIFTTLMAFVEALWQLLFLRPRLILYNGPGVGIPIAIAATLYRKLRFYNHKLVFIESFCRVHDLSVSGKIMYHIADYFLVPWKETRKKYPKAIYLGPMF